MANVEHDVDVVLVFEVAVEAHDVLVVERAVNLDFAGQLLAGLAPRQVRLGDYLKGPGQSAMLFSLDRGDSFYFKSFCESSLSQTLSFGLMELTLPRNRPFS